jgi:Asp/Glu/hydantoin racemase
MPTLLLINPNTSASVTGLMADVMRPLLGPGVDLVPATARLGASYIASEAAYAVAAHAALDAWATFRADGGRCDAVVVGCFGDPGVAALREVAGVPVAGLAEAALREAAVHGPHAIVTGGAAWRPMLERFALANGLAECLAGIHVVDRSGVELMAMPDGGAAELLDALRTAAAPPVRAVVIGGAALGGIAQRVAPRVGVPVIDSVQAGARWAVGALAAPSARAACLDAGVRWSGVSEALAAAMAGPAAGGR